MVILRLQHSFQGISGLPRDQYVNTYHFTAASIASFDFEGLAGAVKAFYGTAPTGQTRPIAWYMSGISDTAGARVKIYDLGDPMPRSPLWDEPYNPSSGYGSTGGQNLPTECACCLSYKAPPLAGIPPPQLRGRIYLGPFTIEALAGGGVGVAPAVDAGLRQIIVDAAKDLAVNSAAVGGAWSVFSPTRGAAAEISEVWVDDAWDIIRGRGEDPVSRLSALIP